jgi:hypothetical protein
VKRAVAVADAQRARDSGQVAGVAKGAGSGSRHACRSGPGRGLERIKELPIAAIAVVVQRAKLGPWLHDQRRLADHRARGAINVRVQPADTAASIAAPNAVASISRGTSTQSRYIRPDLEPDRDSRATPDHAQCAVSNAQLVQTLDAVPDGEGTTLENSAGHLCSTLPRVRPANASACVSIPTRGHAPLKAE